MSNLPWNMGQTFLKMVRPPTPKYWPNEYSMKSSGIPINNIMITYGMRNAPKTENFHLLLTARWFKTDAFLSAHACRRGKLTTKRKVIERNSFVEQGTELSEKLLSFAFLSYQISLSYQIYQKCCYDVIIALSPLERADRFDFTWANKEFYANEVCVKRCRLCEWILLNDKSWWIYGMLWINA